jgi:hypothetical protein
MKFLSLIIMSSFIQLANADVINCKLTIKDNKVKCPLLKSCSQKTLRKSVHIIQEEMTSGQSINGSVKLDGVVLFPGTRKQEKNSVFLFKDDTQPETLAEKQDIDLVRYETNHKIDYQLSLIGNVLKASFKTKESNYKMEITGSYNGSIQGWIFTQVIGEKSRNKMLPIYLSCQKIDLAIFNQKDSKEKAIENFLKKNNASEVNAQ